MWAFEAAEAAAAVLLVGRRRRRAGRRRQPRQEGVRASTPKTGKEKWNFADRGAGGRLAGGRRRAGVRRVPVATTANFYVLDLKTGKKIQELELDSAVSGSVAVGPDCILVGTDKGTLYCLGKK